MNDTGLETRFMTRAGQVIELRRAGDPSLPAPVQDGPSLREIVWGVDTDQALDTLAANLLTDRKVYATWRSTYRRRCCRTRAWRS
jgi:hypothetical protein